MVDSFTHIQIMSVLSIFFPTIWCDDGFQANFVAILYYKSKIGDLGFFHLNSQLYYSTTFYPLRFDDPLSKMTDNIQWGTHDIDLGAEDEPIQLPQEAINQVAAQNHIMIIGAPVMTQHQNIHSIVAVLPCLWGHARIVHGRIIEGRRFQFVFPT